VNAVLALDAPEDVLRERLLARGESSGRADDISDVIDHRLQVYAKETRPLLDYYEGRGVLRRIDATPEPDVVFQSILDSLADLPESIVPPDPDAD
jgi:adenylate kinase family enzyme